MVNRATMHDVAPFAALASASEPELATEHFGPHGSDAEWSTERAANENRALSAPRARPSRASIARVVFAWTTPRAVTRTHDDEQAALHALVQQLFLPVGTATDGLRASIFLSDGAAPAEHTSIDVAQTLVRHTGRTVCLVDANLRDPMLHRHFALGNATGFFDLLDGTATVAEASTLVAPSWWVITTGQWVPGVSLSPGASARVVASLLAAFDFVIVAASSLGARPEALELAQSVGGAVLVVDQRTTTRAAARRCIGALRNADVRISGAVLRRKATPRTRAWWWR